MPRADEDTLQKVRAILSESLRNGGDPAELLDAAGLIQHPALGQNMRRDMLRAVADTLDEIPCERLAVSLGQRMATTPLDVKRQIVAWLRKIGDAK